MLQTIKFFENISTVFISNLKFATKQLFLLLIIGFFQPFFGQLKLEEIMKGEGFIGNLPKRERFLPNGKIIFSWNPEDSLIDFDYIFHPQSGRLEKVSKKQSWFYPRNALNYRNGVAYYVANNALMKWKIGASAPEMLILDSRGFHQMQVNKNGDQIFYCQDNHCFAYSVLSGKVKELFSFKEEKNEYDFTQNYLNRQQVELFEVIKKKEAIAFAEKKESKLVDDLCPMEIEMDGFAPASIALSDDGNFAVISAHKYPKNDLTHIENYLTSSGFSKLQNARPKVGAKDPETKLFLIDLNERSSTVISIDKLNGVLDQPTFKQEYLKVGDQLVKLNNPKKVAFSNLSFAENKSYCMIEIKSYDNKDRWLAILDAKEKVLTEIDHQHDEAWIGGPGISSWKEVGGKMGWINEHTVYFQSEATGYSHLYTYDLVKKNKSQLTSGKFEVHDLVLSKDKTLFYVSLNADHPGVRNFYKLEINNGKLLPLLSGEGNFEVSLSPDEKSLLYRYSSSNQPWELYYKPSLLGGAAVQITHSLKPEFANYSWRKPEVVNFEATDGAKVHARIYRPEKEINNGAAIIFVHGAGYLQNAHFWWSVYYREYMFHNLLADKGYTVLDVDYRASEGYGRDWRTGIYRHMGGKDLADQIDGKKYLVENEGIDPARVGIYGGSYGGFITLMALLTAPDEFKCGAAIRSVTDWAHYNHGYTSNILNTPQEDSVAFRRSSPVYFAGNLKNRLLMLHGMVDDNVQYQDVVRLSQLFIEKGIKNWDLVGYPVEPHGFVETSSWVDEYGRILDLFNEELLPEAKPK